jgi:hypothetical protein
LLLLFAQKNKMRWLQSGRLNKGRMSAIRVHYGMHFLLATIYHRPPSLLIFLLFKKFTNIIFNLSSFGLVTAIT